MQCKFVVLTHGHSERPLSIETPPRDVNYLKEVFAGNGGVPIWLSFGFRSGTAVDCALDGEWPDSTPAEDCFFKDLAFDDVIVDDQGMKRSWVDLDLKCSSVCPRFCLGIIIS